MDHADVADASKRVDPKVPIEDTMAVLNKYGESYEASLPGLGTHQLMISVESGKIGSIGLSECSAATLERASKACIHFHKLPCTATKAIGIGWEGGSS